jgi:uncharacterized phage protein (TIGR02218 family)
MKTTSTDYAREETQKKRKPTELYHLWREGTYMYGDEHWRYTSADFPITYGGETYTPALVGRGAVSHNTEFEVTTLRCNFGYVEDPVIEYIAQNPVEPIWIEVLKWYEDVTPEEASVVFVGQVKNVSFEGNRATALCVGFEHYLQQRIPKFRFQLGCNNDLFDDYCGLSRTVWGVYGEVTALDTDGVVLTGSIFATKETGWFTRGFVKWGDYFRMIVDHDGASITIRFPMPGFTAGENVQAYAGCDKQLHTCVEKFDNMVNFFGHPWIPLDNPAMWTP